MDYLWDAIFKMAAIEINRITFSPITQFSKIDRDMILVSKPHVYMDKESNDNTNKSL